MRRRQIGCVLALAAVAGVLIPATARADDGNAKVDLEKDTKAEEAAAPPEAPPPRPYEKSLVLDASGGVLAFLGSFGKIVPPGPWFRAQLGYEVFKWLMPFVEGELGFTDTSGTQPQPRTRAFPLFGFGGGLRVTVRFAERFGVFAQGSVGAMKAEIDKNGLAILGYRDAESLGPYLGGRLGVEWYQIDRHFALGLTGGIRVAQGFAKLGPSAGTPLAVDGGVSLRYAF